MWDRSWVGHVQITVAETLGVGSRGGFYEDAGAMRDIVQNHVLQVLALALMEPPAHARAIPPSPGRRPHAPALSRAAPDGTATGKVIDLNGDSHSRPLPQPGRNPAGRVDRPEQAIQASQATALLLGRPDQLDGRLCRGLRPLLTSGSGRSRGHHDTLPTRHKARWVRPEIPLHPQTRIRHRRITIRW
ncbi:hypothetical protein [Micromonospora inaquosa]|uniref:hypothetical protein n=1 Tax=Micromonospora inaquosa TaxID=2203716 RepID=UPI003F4CEE78